jgi:hypothetical protein
MEDQEVERQIEALQAKIHMAASYRAMCQTAGFADLKKELEARIADLRNKWLSADDEESRKIKLRGQVYNEILDLVKSKILAGDMAAKTVDELREQQKDQI